MGSMRISLWLVMSLLVACGRREPARPTPAPAAAPAARELAQASSVPAAADAVAAADTPAASVPPLGPLAHPAAELVVAIGDLHGDLDATRRALRLAGAIDAQDQWVGARMVVVQTGDILDRGDDERAILELTDRLRGDAQKTGGAFLALSGNHELMNVAQDFRYVTPGGFQAFKPEGGRDVAFKPGGSWARRLAERPLVVKVGDSVFVHGGVLPKHVTYGLARMNDELHAWMLGQRAEPPAPVIAEDGPVWTRVYSHEGQPADCEQLGRALALLGAKRMVVGHTPQAHGITSACDGRVWRIDVGMAHHYGGPIAVLELRGDSVKARTEALEPAR
jgi:Calcineurin-like phosphoesterase